MIRKGIRARIRPALDLSGRGGLRCVFPFRRSWIAIGVVAVFDAVFIIPAVIVFDQAAEGWSHFEDLFDLVAALFSSAWLLGWSIAPLAITVVLVLMLFGREVVSTKGDAVRLFFGLPVIGVAAEYKAVHLRNPRLDVPEKKSGKSWRGPHLAFDYGANTVAFGSDVGEAELATVINAIETASGKRPRHGAAMPEELEGRWDPVAEPVPGSRGLAEPGHAREPVTWASPSTLMLIAANLVPVAGMAYLGWALGDVMVLYWAESAVIGFYNLCKLAVIDRWLALLTGTFFIAHFGAFMVVHFLFIWGIFVAGFDDASGGDLQQVARHFVGLWPALLALFVSHGVSFFSNFIGRREYFGRSTKDQMAEPYTRVVLMHLVIIFGGGLAMILGSPTPVLLLVIAGKIWFDVRAHIRERARVD